MSQTVATKLISKLRFKINDRRKLRNVDGPQGRHDKIKKTLTALLKHERLELNYHRADETRGYVERLISDAIRNGDRHKETMEMASYWIIEPPIVHKLFKVLAPRYSNFDKSYTKLWRAPNIYPGHGHPKCILELRNNIYPSLEPDQTPNKNLIHNVLLEEAKKVYKKNKADMAAKKVAMEQRIISESEAWISKTKENVKSETAVDDKLRAAIGDSESVNEASTSESATEVSASKPSSEASANKSSIETSGSELPTEETLKADSVSKGETKIKSEVDSSLEADLDKMKIAKEKPKETPSKDEKK